MNRKNIENSVYDILKAVGVDVNDSNIRKTPERVAKAIEELLSGYSMDIDGIFKDAFFKVDYKEMVIVKDITFYSVCEHHLLPFFGKAHIGYIPDGVIVGLSKIARLVEVFSRRLQVQERMTVEISKTLYERLKPRGVGVVIEAQHMCMTSRGVKNSTSLAVTTSMLGCFEKDERIRSEFFSLIKSG